MPLAVQKPRSKAIFARFETAATTSVRSGWGWSGKLNMGYSGATATHSGLFTLDSLLITASCYEAAKQQHKYIVILLIYTTFMLHCIDTVDINDKTQMRPNMQIADTTESNSGFPVPFTKNEFKKDILETMLILLNQTRFTFLRDQNSDLTLWSVLSTRPLEYAGAFANPDNGPSDIDLTFTDIESIEMVKNLVQLYDYGMHGIYDDSMYEMDDCEGQGNWTSRILYDLSRSEFLNDWIAYRGDEFRSCVERCLMVTELANARLVLEGASEGFYLGSQNTDALDIRQMSLLAAMTEGSIRTLANPNRKNALITTKDALGSGIHIEIENAKAWLISKGRYVPIKKVNAVGAEDFTKFKFSTIAEFEFAIFNRLQFLKSKLGNDAVNLRVSNAGVKLLQRTEVSDSFRQFVLGEDQMLDVALMSRLAEALELPVQLFALRAAEAATAEKLRNIEQLLKKVQQST